MTSHGAYEVALEHKHRLPDCPALLAQLIQTGNHFMLPSYIPACWATLRRWQEAHISASPLATKREYEWIDNALARITQQLRDAERSLAGRGAPNGRSESDVNIALIREVDKLHSTRARLATLRTASVSEKDVYGSLSEHPEQLAQDLARWQAHPENREEEQLAMAPTRDDDGELIRGAHGYAIGEPYTLDLDSIV